MTRKNRNDLIGAVIAFGAGFFIFSYMENEVSVWSAAAGLVSVAIYWFLREIQG